MNISSPDIKSIKKALLEKESGFAVFAARSDKSKGREEAEGECEFRTEFQRDRDRILHSKAFRRLKRKTQVFFAPKNDHLRTRLTHTLEVQQISRTIARILNLNEDLTEAIALGHDLGHAPFGHSGEHALFDASGGNFKHNVHGIRIARVLEKLNLTAETLDGILNHTGDTLPFTLEGQVVKISDRIAYLNHDIEDAVRAKIIKISDIPKEFSDYFGIHKHERIRKVVSDIYMHSYNQSKIEMSTVCVNFLNELRAWMFKNVYFSDKTTERECEVTNIVTDLYKHYAELYGTQAAIDYVAGMSDEFAFNKHRELCRI
ncbi:dGTPase [Candidatus Gastranaerophilus sp. (ex Termes propinquus)]|nr:dGTPase [Candidatus Gastranaerophilus sp. (ex Termes propinquus)]